jgi:GNAT superfamily N-acetyltransferase
MWRPEREVRGPEPVTERDIPALNRLFADAFTDRYRRDGLVGVRVPFLNEVVWRYAIASAGEGAMLWRDEGDRTVAFNLAHRSGGEGWMGPLCVRPDRQLGGLGKTIVLAAVDWLRAQGVTTLGLETMPRTVDNIGFYSRLGFVPGHLTLTMTRDSARGDGELELLGRLPEPERRDAAAAVDALVAALAPGFVFAKEVALTLKLGLGDVVLLREDGALRAFALCHAAALAEGGGREEVRVLKLGAVDLPALRAVLDRVAAWADRMAVRRIAVRCQSAYTEAYRVLVESGWRVRWSDLRMTMAGFAEPTPSRGVLWSNWEI